MPPDPTVAAMPVHRNAGAMTVRPLVAELLGPARRRTVLFACVHNAGRSQMAAAFFNAHADPRRAHAVSAGTQPAGRVHEPVVRAMREVGIDLDGARPTLLTADLACRADILVTMGCGEECPHVHGLRKEDWPLPDPKHRSLEEVRAVRDEVRRRVLQLIAREGFGRE